MNRRPLRPERGVLVNEAVVPDGLLTLWKLNLIEPEGAAPKASPMPSSCRLAPGCGPGAGSSVAASTVL